MRPSPLCSARTSAREPREGRWRRTAVRRAPGPGSRRPGGSSGSSTAQGSGPWAGQEQEQE
jgi:hypothetical protein